MKILSVLLTLVFILLTTSIAQVRYALQNSSEIPNLLISIAMAICIYLLVSNIGKIRLNNFIKQLNTVNFKKGYFRKAYRIS